MYAWNFDIATCARRIALVLAFSGIAFAQARAQRPILGLSTDDTSPAALFTNPALATFQSGKLALGARAYHVGLGAESGAPALRQGYFIYSTPHLFRHMIGTGIGIQYFDSPIYRRTLLQANASVRLFRFASIGAGIGAMRLSYNRANFQLEDPGDPVFAAGLSKTTLISSLGLYLEPVPFLKLSGGIRNVNGPNLSLIGDPVTAPMELFAGTALSYGPVRAVFELGAGPSGSSPRTFLELFSTEGNFVRVGGDLGTSTGLAQAQLHVGGPLSVNYRYDLPIGDLLGESMGSHQFSVIFEFDRVRKRPHPVVPPPYLMELQHDDRGYDIQPRVYLASDSDHLEIYEQEITRKIGERITDDALASLRLADVGVLDSSFSEPAVPYQVQSVAPLSSEVTFTTAITPEYQTSIRSLSRAISEHPDTLAIIGESDVLTKAVGLRNRFVFGEGVPTDRVSVSVPRPLTREDSMLVQMPVQPDKLRPTERLVYSSPDSASFRVYPIYFDGRGADRWSLVFLDDSDRVVQTFEGGSGLPAELAWDWRARSGDLLEPGVYSYFLEWVDEAGAVHRSNMRHLFIQKYARRTTIEITRSPRGIDQDAEQLQLLIRN